LGGFLAEGVAADYPGAHCRTIQPGAPLIKKRGCATPCAFNPRQKDAILPVRYIRKGDLVTHGVENLGEGVNVEKDSVGGSGMLFRMRKVLKQYSASGTFFDNTRMLMEMVKEALKHKLTQHSLKHYLPWDREEEEETN
jgi:hypothetical protein